MHFLNTLQQNLFKVPKKSCRVIILNLFVMDAQIEQCKNVAAQIEDVASLQDPEIIPEQIIRDPPNVIRQVTKDRGQKVRLQTVVQFLHDELQARNLFQTL
jgi:hypothetical protein